jgi:putative phage-type endonuclease
MTAVVCHTTAPGWLAARLTGIGASEIASVLGESPWKSALELWGEKTGSIASADLSGSEAVEWGHRLEPVILVAYAERSGRAAAPSGELLRCEQHPWALVTLDGVTSDGEASWPLEIKAVGAARGDEWADGPPAHYRLQLQHQMLVTGAQRATIAALIGGQKLVWADVARDEQTIRRIVYHGERFWRLVEAGTPPEPDGSESAKRALLRLSPQDDGSTIALPGDLIDVLDELEEIKSVLSKLEAAKLEHENRLRAALGAATRGVLADGRAVSWKSQTMPERVLRASTTRVLRIHKAKESK